MATLSDRIEDYCFFDFETRSKPGSGAAGDLRTAGTYRYAANSYPIILTYAIGDGPVRMVTSYVFGAAVTLPDELRAFWERANEGKAWFVAWNTAFDRMVWNNHYAPMTSRMALDAMCQAMASNLPADLESASRALGGPGKQKDGKALIRLFSPSNGATPKSHPKEWAQFCAYAMRDTAVLRDVWKATMPLDRAEWEDYWISERINQRGIGVDVEFARKAHEVYRLNALHDNDRLRKITGIDGMRVSTVQQIARWVHERIASPIAREIIEEPTKTDPDTGEILAFKLTLARERIAELLLYLEAHPEAAPQEVVDVLQIREYGGSSSPVKFDKIVQQQVNKRLQNQYVFNGAMQTGRFSSRGVQIHNLPRATIVDDKATRMDIEEDAISLIRSEAVNHDMLAELTKHGPVARSLTRLIRPAFVAPEPYTLVWGDFSSIEARINPWLEGGRLGEAKLELFRQSDADPSMPDVYMQTGASLLGCAAADVTKAQRQSHGKVPELALGFGGAMGALQNMATTYGVYIEEDQSKRMIAQWREANPWARHFWDILWEAAKNALAQPYTGFRAGRVTYVYLDDYMKGSLVCTLPCGHRLVYPQMKWEIVEDEETGEETWQLGYRKGHGRAHLWYGKLCENVTQAAAGSLLKAKLRTFDQEESDWLPVVAHTHDEIICEVREDNRDDAEIVIKEIMTEAEDWSAGLPLAAEIRANWYFTKAAD